MDKPHELQAATTVSVQIQLTLVKFEHAIGGLYLWEYLTTLDYEWGILRGRIRHRWTLWLYFVARFAALVSVILNFVTMDVTTPINCQLWTLFAAIFLCLGSIGASLLIVLRTIAIWNRNKIVMMLTIIVWGSSIGFHLHNITLIRSTWFSAQLACVCVKGDFSALGFIPSIIADMALLLIILAGLLVMRHRGGCTFGLTRLIWNQGIIWLILASAAEVPQLVYSSLHLNDQLRSLFEIPSQMVIIIAATRMHRSLLDFTSGPSDVVHEIPQMSNLASSKIKQTDTPSTAPNRVEIAIHTAIEQHPTDSTKDDDSSTIISISEQMLGDPSQYPAATKASYAA